jgi:CheY-like chemotaxis protein
MKYIHNNAKQELMSLIHSIHRDPSSWEGWSCLHIDIGKAKRRYETVRLHGEIKAILERYFTGGKGTTLFVEETDIYVFIKDAVSCLMEDAGGQISRLLRDKCGAETNASCWLLQPEKEISEREHPSGDRDIFTKVLLVDDDPVTRWMVRAALKGECTLLTASTAGGAIESYHKCKPDLVLLDLDLPDKNGMEVMQSIFNDDPRANVVVFSAHDNIENMVRMLETGASGFVAKPFTRQRLLTHVRRLAG